MSSSAQDGSAESQAPTASVAARSWAPPNWALWKLNPSLVIALLMVEITAVALLVLGVVVGGPPTSVEVRTTLLLCLLGVLHTEIARDVEQVRRRVLIADMHVNLSSVWFFAGAVLLPPAYAGACACVVFTHLWWRRSTGARAPLHRQMFSTASFFLASFAASAVMTYAAGPPATATGLAERNLPVLLLGMLVFATLNTGLVGGAIAISNPQAQIGQVVGDWDENLLEIATLTLGAVSAVAIVVNPWLVLFALLPLLVLHRAVLVRHLEDAASTDGKTGLLNAAAWHTQAERELRRAVRADRPRAVLVLDLDHFKVVNDTYGHIAGDHVLAAVADAMRAEVRDRDLVGRFGGEEFVILLAGLDGASDVELEAVAQRIRRRIAALRVEIPTADGPLTIAGLSVSIGGAVHAGDGADLQALLQIADTALYSVKRSGRNAVRMGRATGEEANTERESVPVRSTPMSDHVPPDMPWGAH